MEKYLVVLSGAGISAESGIKTFRDAGGLWEGHDVMEVASASGYKRNKPLVLDFYNQRRRQLLSCHPNKAHLLLAELQNYFNTVIVTQNVDDLHRRAGSKHIVHLHGELLKVRSEIDPGLVYDWTKDLSADHTNELGHGLRPHIVWFEEQVPQIPHAIELVEKADVLLVIGTSLSVYPAASLLGYAKKDAVIYYIDPNPAHTHHFDHNITTVAQKATIALEQLWPELIALSQK